MRVAILVGLAVLISDFTSSEAQAFGHHRRRANACCQPVDPCYGGMYGGGYNSWNAGYPSTYGAISSGGYSMYGNGVGNGWTTVNNSTQLNAGASVNNGVNANLQGRLPSIDGSRAAVNGGIQSPTIDPSK